MEFRDGARSLRLRVEESEILGGEPGDLGLSCWAHNQLRIAGDSVLSPEQRLPVVCHELAHWYEWKHPGPPIDPEERADWMAAYATWIIRELARQGGEEALKRLMAGGGTMTPGEALALGRPVSASEPYATECPGCTCMVAGQSVVRSVAVPHESGISVVWMAMMCGECGDHWRWSCAAEGGRSTTACVDAPVRVTDRVEIGRFITAHPKQAGAVMAT